MAKFSTITRIMNAVGKNGRSVKIYEKTEYFDAQTWGNPNAPPDEGMKSYVLSDGSGVNQISETEFEILDGERLRLKP